MQRRLHHDSNPAVTFCVILAYSDIIQADIYKRIFDPNTCEELASITVLRSRKASDDLEVDDMATPTIDDQL
jgi:hypothetical protein